MSNLQKGIARPPTRPLPRPRPRPSSSLPEGDVSEEDSSSASSMSSTGTIVPHSNSQRNPVSLATWHEYFDQELYLQSPTRSAKFHVYLTSPANPLKDPLFVCHHGAGASGLSFALFSREIRLRMLGAGVLSVEARDHGSFVANKSHDQSTDFSLDALSQDLLEMIQLTQARCWKELPNLVLLGHSLGGAVVTRVAKGAQLGNKLLGYGVIDVVEGSAIEALKSMQTYLASRPSTFPSVEAAIDWHVRSRTIRNPSSARVSTPTLLVEVRPGLWTWRTDLASTQPFWQDWFKGLSSAFLSGRAAKLLILAGTDRLDKELMIGQMQGKFQMQVFPEAGHFVQEDLPGRTAELVAEFYKRNDRSALVLPPKVSELLAQGKKV